MIRKTLNLFMLLSLALFVVGGATSCTKEGCTDPNATNYDEDAKEDDGTCILPRDEFLGTYNVNESCTSGNFTYTITITQSSTGTDKIIINNFGSYGVNVTATVDGTGITFSDTQGGITFVGSGSLASNILTISYTASAGGGTDSCTKTCTKQ